MNPEKKFQHVGNRKELHPKKYEANPLPYDQITSLNLSLKSQTKRKQNSSNFKFITFSTIPRNCHRWNIRLQKNNSKQRPDLHSRLYHHPWYWQLWKWTKEWVQPFECAKNNLDKNQKHYFHFTPTDFQRKIITEIDRNPAKTSKKKFTNIM